MATTTNYSWSTPDDTALVKDGAAAIRTLGSSVDTTVKALNPETTLGDLAYRSSTANVKTRLALGTAGQVLQVNSGATAPEWVTPASGGMTLINTGGTTLTGTAVSISSIPATFVNLFLVIRNFLPANDGEYMRLRYNNDSGSNRYASFEIAAGANNQGFTTTSMRIGQTQDSGQSEAITTALIYDYANTTTWKHAFVQMIENNSTTPANLNFLTWTSVYNQTSAIDQINILCNSGNFTSGTAFLYGVK
jgi:hypothetical protein